MHSVTRKKTLSCSIFIFSSFQWFCAGTLFSWWKLVRGMPHTHTHTHTSLQGRWPINQSSPTDFADWWCRKRAVFTRARRQTFYTINAQINSFYSSHLQSQKQINQSNTIDKAPYHPPSKWKPITVRLRFDIKCKFCRNIFKEYK